MRLAGLAALAFTGYRVAVAVAKRRTLRTAERVDLERYLGTWYEVARLPAFFERGCVGITATYSQAPDGHIRVVNRCSRGSCSGKHAEIEGSARVVDAATNARLKVHFRGPFGGDYWILDVGSSYDYALVGTPSRKRLWILSRTPVMDESLFERLVEEARDLGFPTAKLIRAPVCASP